MTTTDIPAPKRQIGELEKYQTVVSSGQAALRALLTLNGGATIAFLTFLGHLWDKDKFPKVNSSILVDALELFVYGTFLAVLAYGFIFFTNCLSTRDWKIAERATYTMFGITVATGIVSAGYFVAASRRAIEGFTAVTGALPLP